MSFEHLSTSQFLIRLETFFRFCNNQSIPWSDMVSVNAENPVTGPAENTCENSNAWEKSTGTASTTNHSCKKPTNHSGQEFFKDTHTLGACSLPHEILNFSMQRGNVAIHITSDYIVRQTIIFYQCYCTLLR